MATKYKNNLLKIIWSIVGLISLIYLLNPTAGIVELIPDNLPLIGNIDEASFTMLLRQAIVEIYRL